MSLVHFPGKEVGMFFWPGITHPFQRLQEVLSFFELLNTDDNFVSCTFGNILQLNKLYFKNIFKNQLRDAGS